MIRLLVGLGNPGSEYADTRHNAGFWWVDEAARRLGAHLQLERSYYGMAARVSVRGEPVWLLQPMTYMNLSGKSVAALAKFFKIPPSEVLVIHDELDIAPGQIKLKQGGGHAGHNGLKDIHAQLGSPDYWRLRIGIGHPGDRAAVAGYVLGKPKLEDRLLMDEAIQRSISVLDALIDGDMQTATRAIHTPTKKAEPAPSKKTEAPPH